MLLNDNGFHKIFSHSRVNASEFLLKEKISLKEISADFFNYNHR